MVLAVLLLGIAVRVGFWLLAPPNWRLSAVYYPLHFDVLGYVADFEGYKHSRMPFFDVVAAGSYLLFSDILGRRSLTLPNLLVGVGALPLFYLALKGMFSRRVGLYGLTLYAFMPKLVVIGGQGMPEQVAVGMLVASLYAVEQGRRAGKLGWYAAAGVAATLSFLAFVPAVAFTLLLAGYLYWQENVDRGWDQLVPARPVWVYCGPPGVVGTLYLLFGPLQKMVATTSGDFGAAKSSLFAHPGAYSVVEKTIRYVSYAYYDFWWHGRGFEDESALMGSLVGYRSLFGDMFGLYIAGWALLTLSLTALVVVGVYVLVRQNTPVAWFVVAWLAIYLGLYNFRNVGWTGVFNTRHILPIVPAVCIAFGVGGATLDNRLRDFELPAQMSGLGVRQPTRQTLFLVTILVVTGVLLVNGAASSIATAGAYDISRDGAVERLQSVVGPDETVAVTEFETYHVVVIYSEFTLRPVILTQTEERLTAISRRTVQGDVRIVPPSDIATEEDIDYLFVVESNKDQFSAEQRAYIDSAARKGTVIVRDRIVREWPQRRVVNVAIVRLDGDR